jgi:hypothetical protein
MVGPIGAGREQGGRTAADTGKITRCLPAVKADRGIVSIYAIGEFYRIG